MDEVGIYPLSFQIFEILFNIDGKTKISEMYLKLWEANNLFFIAFPTSFKAKFGFNVDIQLLNKQINRL